MANVTINGLTAGSALAGTEPIPAWQSSATVKTTPAAISAYIRGTANTWSGQQTFGTSSPIFSTMTLGSVLVAGTSGLLNQDNGYLFWDFTNHRLGLGHTAPSTLFHQITTATQQHIVESTTSGGTGVSAVQAIFRGAAGGYGGGIGFQSKETGTNTYILQGSIEAEGSAAWSSVGAASSFMRFSTANAGTLTEWMRLTSTGKLLLGSTSASAMLYLPAGTATAFTAPLKFTSGTNLTTAEAGAWEYNGTNFFCTRTGTTRECMLSASAVTTETIVSDTSVTVNINGTTYKLLARA